jgi:hypothetical protein
MSTDLLRTGADVLRSGASIKVECRECESVLILAPDEFATLCGSGSLGSFAKRRQCDNCGAKRTQLLVLPPSPNCPPEGPMTA